MSDTHTTCPTPNPAERSLIVQVPENKFADAAGVIPPQGTLYGASAFKTLLSTDYRKNFANFVYTGQVGDFGLQFAMNKTTEEANTPFRTTTWFGNHRWPPILLAVAVIEDYGAPRSFTRFSGTALVPAIGPTYYDRVVYIPDVSEGTRFVKDEFVGPTQFVIPQTPVPVATSVDYLLPGGVGRSFPECLHPKIEIPPTSTANAQLIAGVATGIGTSLEGQLFPATNFEEWAPYVLSDTQEMQGGVWYRVRIRVFPPGQPDAIVSQ